MSQDSRVKKDSLLGVARLLFVLAGLTKGIRPHALFSEFGMEQGDPFARGQ
eukprot:COSAG02_NODE_1828_length_10742_cov_3.513013_3_plen_51_part_00